MALKETIETEYKNALKAKDKTKISTYRLILSSIKDLDIVNRSGPNKKDTDDEDIKKILKKMVKQRTESIDIYKKNNRTDLLEVEQNEYEILSCIEWDHYKYPSSGISGNFVVALGKQIWNNQTTIWAATVGTGESGENQGLSYSRDDGVSWKTALLGERVYNIDAKDSLVFVSTSSGLWKSLDGENWAKFDPAIEKSLLNQRQILTNSVYAAKIDSRDSIPKLWVGTPDGVALSINTQGDDWKIFQADHDFDEVYAYPNPFSPLTHNMLDSDGYVRFHVGNIVNKEVKIDIFNFAMEKVHSKTYNLNSYYGAIKWDGRDMLGKHVANGVYFIRINYSKSRNQSPGDNWTKLIVVK